MIDTVYRYEATVEITTTRKVVVSAEDKDEAAHKIRRQFEDEDGGTRVTIISCDER